MLLPQSGSGEFVGFQATGTPANLKVLKADGSSGAASSTFTMIGGMGTPRICKVAVAAADINIVGPLTFWVEDGTNVIVGSIDIDVRLADDFAFGVSETGLLSFLGLATGNLDAQFAAITPGLTQADVRTAVGLASANLDTQLAALTPLTAAGVRAAIGLAAANLDTQLAAIGPGLTAAGVRAAIGLASANLDSQIAGAPDLLLDLANGVETAITVRKALRAIGAVLCGEALISGGHSIYDAIGNAGTPRVDGTTPGLGNRTNVSLTL